MAGPAANAHAPTSVITNDWTDMGLMTTLDAEGPAAHEDVFHKEFAVLLSLSQAARIQVERSSVFTCKGLRFCERPSALLSQKCFLWPYKERTSSQREQYSRLQSVHCRQLSTHLNYKNRLLAERYEGLRTIWRTFQAKGNSRDYSHYTSLSPVGRKFCFLQIWQQFRLNVFVLVRPSQNFLVLSVLFFGFNFFRGLPLTRCSAQELCSFCLSVIYLFSLFCNRGAEAMQHLVKRVYSVTGDQFDFAIAMEFRTNFAC